MLNLLNAEWIKVRSVRVNIVLACLAAAIPIIIVVLVAALEGHPSDQSTQDFIGLITGTMVLTSLLMGVIGALNLTGEFSHGTIRTTFAATPKRRQVLVVKAIVALVSALVFAAVVAVVCVVVGPAILGSRGAPQHLESHHWSALLGVVLLAGLLALFGYGLGLLIRSSPATVVVFVLWPLLLEGLIALVLRVAGVDDPIRWLPYQRAIQMANPETDGDHGRWAGGIYMGVVVLVIIAVGIFVNERRDA